jgi:hypothetical protein
MPFPGQAFGEDLMCGDLEEDGDRLENDLYARFRLHARTLLAGRAAGEAAAPDKDLHAYMDRLFADALTRSARDCEAADEAKRYDVLAMQPLVFARLAGFLAGHVSLREDPLRKVMEALMHGYAEAEHIAVDHHGHDHDHHHHHGHDHHHGH